MLVISVVSTCFLLFLYVPFFFFFLFYFFIFLLFLLFNFFCIRYFFYIFLPPIFSFIQSSLWHEHQSLTLLFNMGLVERRPSGNRVWNTTNADRTLEDMGYKPEFGANRSIWQVTFMCFILSSVPYGLSTTLYYLLLLVVLANVIWGWVIICSRFLVAISLAEYFGVPYCWWCLLPDLCLVTTLVCSCRLWILWMVICGRQYHDYSCREFRNRFALRGLLKCL